MAAPPRSTRVSRAMAPALGPAAEVRLARGALSRRGGRWGSEEGIQETRAAMAPPPAADTRVPRRAAAVPRPQAAMGGTASAAGSPLRDTAGMVHGVAAEATASAVIRRARRVRPAWAGARQASAARTTPAAREHRARAAPAR